MSQDLVVVLICDVCGTRDDDVQTYSIGGQAVDVCAPDSEGRLSIVDLVALFGKGRAVEDARPDRVRAKYGDIWQDPNVPAMYRTCPVCGFGSTNRLSTDQHVRSQHGRTLIVAEREAGTRYICSCREEFDAFGILSRHVRKMGKGHGLAAPSGRKRR